MAKNRRSSVLKKSSNQIEVKESDILQAVVLADSFTREFRPITLSTPRTLLPLVNIPVLEYILELLAASDVQEIYVFCCENAQQIKNYIQTSKWNQKSPKVRVLTGIDTTCACDALRSIHDMNIIRSDFVLITGDVIANADLRPIIMKHREETSKSKNSPLLMTSLFKEQPSYKINTVLGFNDARHSVWLAMAPEENQLLFYDCEKKKPFKIPMSTFKSTSKIQVRSDLFDCHIDICSPRVLDILKENFDYQDLRSDFMVNILTDEIISIDNKVRPYIITDEYASRLSSLRAYEIISRDIIKRWMYPIIPDSNFTATTSYRLYRPNKYLEHDVSFQRSSKVSIDCVLGRGSSIGENSTLLESTVGRNVKIGNNCCIEGSFIWDNVVIEDDVKISASILARNVIIRKGTVIKKGSIIGENVVIGQGFVVQEGKRLTTITVDEEDPDSLDDFDDDNDESRGANLLTRVVETNPAHVGEGGIGAEYEGKFDAEKYNLLGLTDEELMLANKELMDLALAEEADVEDHVIQSGNASENRFFLSEIETVVESAILKNSTIEDSKLELDSVKFAYNPMALQYICAIIRALLQFSIKHSKNVRDGPSSLFTSLLNGTNYKTSWSTLINQNIGEKSDIQVDILDFLLDFFQSDEGEEYEEMISEVILGLYKANIIEREQIIEWSESRQDNSKDIALIKRCEDILQELNKSTTKIVKPKGGWFGNLKVGSSDSDDSDDESDDDTDDDDDDEEDEDEGDSSDDDSDEE